MGVAPFGQRNGSATTVVAPNVGGLSSSYKVGARKPVVYEVRTSKFFSGCHRKPTLGLLDRPKSLYLSVRTAICDSRVLMIGTLSSTNCAFERREASVTPIATPEITSLETAASGRSVNRSRRNSAPAARERGPAGNWNNSRLTLKSAKSVLYSESRSDGCSIACHDSGIAFGFRANGLPAI